MTYKFFIFGALPPHEAALAFISFRPAGFFIEHPDAGIIEGPYQTYASALAQLKKFQSAK